MTTARELDVVVWGATGYAGRLVADYLATAPSARGLRWALAGRNRAVLERLREELRAPELEIIVADARDPRGLETMCARAAVVATTVGPYAVHGDTLVAACVKTSTHACDLAGEPPWIRRTIDQHHQAAAASGAKIVHSCGFDSIPSDLGVLMLDEAMRARGRRLARVDTFFGESKGRPSGGTIASLLQVQEELARNRSLWRLVADPYAFVPGERGPDTRDVTGVRYDSRLGRWTAPFPMAPINAPTVRRSNALLAHRYGKELRYREQMSLFPGARGAAAAAVVTAGFGAFVAALQIPLVRRLIASRLAASGSGPSAEERAAGYFVVRFIAEAQGAPSLTLHGRCEDRRDPGYGSTAVMLAESAMCLAKDGLEPAGGVLTPASAMGMALLARLRAAGMRWEVSERPI
jgi:short subunit dehydrogenase-like uncharacterized protein